jgi:hypothetical protein
MLDLFKVKCAEVFKFDEVAFALKPNCGKTAALALGKFFGHTVPQCVCGTRETVVYVKTLPKTWIDLGKSKNATHVVAYYKPSGTGYEPELVHYVLPTEKLDIVIANLLKQGNELSQVHDLKKAKNLPLENFKPKKKDEGKQEKT